MPPQQQQQQFPPGQQQQFSPQQQPFPGQQPYPGTQGVADATAGQQPAAQPGQQQAPAPGAAPGEQPGQRKGLRRLFGRKQQPGTTRTTAPAMNHGPCNVHVACVWCTARCSCKGAREGAEGRQLIELPAASEQVNTPKGE